MVVRSGQSDGAFKRTTKVVDWPFQRSPEAPIKACEATLPEVASLAVSRLFGFTRARNLTKPYTKKTAPKARARLDLNHYPLSGGR